jgi:serine/threonine protein kinase
MAEVYRARDPKLKRDVAIKVLPQHAANDPERRIRFEREAQSVAALNHPNIVTIYSVEDADGVLFLTMELVEGTPLTALIGTRGLPLDRLLQLAIPLADSISAAHQKGITHRDLKPANVMVTADERLKVLDFGLAKFVEASP